MASTAANCEGLPISAHVGLPLLTPHRATTLARSDVEMSDPSIGLGAGSGYKDVGSGSGRRRTASSLSLDALATVKLV